MGAAESYEYNYHQQRNQILTELANNPEVMKWVSNVTLGNNNCNNDLYQELFLNLGSMPDERLVEMHCKGFLNFYIFRFLTNCYRSQTSVFHRKFKSRKMIHVGFIKDFGFKDEVKPHDDYSSQEDYVQTMVTFDHSFDQKKFLLNLYEKIKTAKPYAQEILIELVKETKQKKGFGAVAKYDIEKLALQIDDTLNKLDWYSREMFLSRNESGLSYTDFSAQLGIPRTNIVKTCVMVKNKIKADLQAQNLQ